MHRARRRPRTIAEEIHRIRAELHTIAASLHRHADTHQRAVAAQKIQALEKRIDESEAQQSRKF